METKVTWNDLHEGTQEELKKTYKLSARELEMQVRLHWDGSNSEEKRELYEKVYGRGKRK